MAERIDALGETHRADLFPGATLTDVSDAELQALVEAAAKECGTPIALVSLVLDNIQYFRAQHGLPPDLVEASGTDRDVSFCQFAVREGEPFEVGDANVADVPTALVDRYGIRSYYGEPIYIRDRVAGTLCVIDFAARDFDEHREAMKQLAAAVSRRLNELADQGIGAIETATTPAFAELRNAMTPISASVGPARTTLEDLDPLVESPAFDSTDQIRSLLATASSALVELREIIDELESSSERVSLTIRALEAALATRTEPTALSVVLQNVSELALHVTRLIGGVRIPEVSGSLTLKHNQKHVTAELAAAIVVIAGMLRERGHEDGLTVLVETNHHDHYPAQVAISLQAEGCTEQELLKNVDVFGRSVGDVSVSDGFVTFNYSVF